MKKYLKPLFMFNKFYNNDIMSASNLNPVEDEGNYGLLN